MTGWQVIGLVLGTLTHIVLLALSSRPRLSPVGIGVTGAVLAVAYALMLSGCGGLEGVGPPRRACGEPGSACCGGVWCAPGAICGGGAPGACFRCGRSGEPCCADADAGPSCSDGARCVSGEGCR